MTARITYRTKYGKKAAYTVRIEELMTELKELRSLSIKVEAVALSEEHSR